MSTRNLSSRGQALALLVGQLEDLGDLLEVVDAVATAASASRSTSRRGRPATSGRGGSRRAGRPGPSRRAGSRWLTNGAASARRQCAARGLGPCLRLHRVGPPLGRHPAPVVPAAGCIEPIQCEWRPIIAKARRTVHGADRANHRTMAPRNPRREDSSRMSPADRRVAPAASASTVVALALGACGAAASSAAPGPAGRRPPPRTATPGPSGAPELAAMLPGRRRRASTSSRSSVTGR